MKTNQNMIRKMGEFEVVQRTSDGFFNATHLFNQWNEKYPKDERRIDNFWQTTNLDLLMREIIENEPEFKSLNFRDYENLSSPNLGDDKNSLTFNDLKSLLSKTTRGKNGCTSLHPVLFVKCAMYLSPRFEYHVLKFVSDEMIKYRNDAGDAYREMSASISKIVEKTFLQTAIKEIAKALNYIVYNNHEPMLMNKQACENLLRERTELEKDIVKLIHFGFVKSFEELRDYLRKRWCEKWQPKVLIA